MTRPLVLLLTCLLGASCGEQVTTQTQAVISTAQPRLIVEVKARLDTLPKQNRHRYQELLQAMENWYGSDLKMDQKQKAEPIFLGHLEVIDQRENKLNKLLISSKLDDNEKQLITKLYDQCTIESLANVRSLSMLAKHDERILKGEIDRLSAIQTNKVRIAQAIIKEGAEKDQRKVNRELKKRLMATY